MPEKKNLTPETERVLQKLTSLMESDTPERRAERKRVSARCGHVKRRLVRNERLEGDLLEFAVGVAGEGTDIAEKLKAGQQLSGYELHLMVDVFLLHARLGVS
jgi:hypothetical protein